MMIRYLQGPWPLQFLQKEMMIQQLRIDQLLADISDASHMS
jgi:hypothetical protein